MTDPCTSPVPPVDVWIHRICERCWFDGLFWNDGTDESVYRFPNQLKGMPPDACCFCGGMTITAIFVRKHQGELLCRGRHDDVSAWSQVRRVTSHE